MQKAPQSTPSYEEILAKFESLKKTHVTFEQSQRRALYGLLQEATKVALSVEANEKFESRFLKKMDEKDVLRAALIFIFDAKSEPAKKEASKRAQALRYLINKLGVSADNIAAAIAKHSGIEKLARMAAQSRDDDGEEDKSEKDEPEDEPEEADKKEDVKSRFGKLVSVGLSPALAEKLNGLADKTRIKIIGYVRMSSDDFPTIDGRRIVELPAKSKKDKPHKDEWA